MKRNIFAVTMVMILTLGLRLGAEAPADYEYVPLVREGVEWVYDWTYYNQTIGGRFFLQFSGDSIINGKTYKVCYRYHTPELNKEDAFIEGFAREEDKRVYVIGRRVPDGGTDNSYTAYDDRHKEEFLAYDFNVDLNGYVRLPNEQEYPIDRIDYVRIGGKLRKAYYAYSGSVGHTLWAIEGIGYATKRQVDGDLISPYLTACACFPTYTSCLAYVHQVGSDTEWGYSHDDFDFDNINDIWNCTELEFGASDGTLTVATPRDEVRCARLLDLDGNVAWSFSHQCVNTVVIPTEDLGKGVYVIEAETSGGASLRQRVVVR